MMYELVATATFGLEAIVRRELEALAFPVIKTEDGRITYLPETSDGRAHIDPDNNLGKTGSQSDIYGNADLARAIAKSNLWLRSADRVYIKMGEFDALNFEELFQSIKNISWEGLIPVQGKVIVVGTSVKSELHSVPACQGIIKKAIVDRLVAAYHLDGILSETGPTFTIRFSILKNHVLVMVDTSGEGLHKRGYRVANVEAPIKETLAAALVQLSFWRSGRILVDPCGGSGTIGIEAALIGLNIAPGLSREFAAEKWTEDGTGVSKTSYRGDSWKNIWKEERRKAYEAIDTETMLDITVGDIDPKAIDAARENAEAAGVDDQIKFITGDMMALPGKPQESGIIICNPPYGERIGEKKEIEKIYGTLGRFIKENPTWSLFMITSDKDAEERVLGRTADRRRKLYNGRIETCYYQFHGDKPNNK